MTIATQNQPLTLLRGIPLLIARCGWIGLYGLLLGTILAAIPSFYRSLLDLSYAEHTFGWSAAQLRPILVDLGWTAGQFAAIMIALALPFTFGFFLIGSAIFILRSNDWMAMLVSIALLLFAWSISRIPHTLLPEAGPLVWFRVFVFILQVLILPLLFYLFPDGRFVPRWTRWLPALWIGLMLSFAIFPIDHPFSPGQWPPAVLFLLWVGLLGSLGLAQAYRYFRVARPVQRQQIKWVTFSLLLNLAAIVLFAFTGSFFPDMSQEQFLFYIASALLLIPLFTLVPIAIAIAILRFHLWDIDLVIRRTLLYTGLSGLLGGVYLGSVLLLQRLLAAAVGEDSPLVLVLSTLLIAGLFQPLRRFLQKWIDRRFFRTRYDPARILARFARVARDEVELSRVIDELMTAIRESLRPEQTSLWLKNHFHVQGDHR